MARRIALTFAFFACLAGSHAMATSPVMECIASCNHDFGIDLGSCAELCGA